jgi:hypothetical protein
MMKNRIVSLIIGIVLGLICIALAAVIILAIHPANRNYPEVTPVITVISAPTIEPTPQVSITPVVTPTEDNGLPPDPGSSISVGVNVRISGTGGEGLRLRKDPGKNGTPIFLGAENEVFIVKDGPRNADGFNWWYLEGTYDNTRAGWAVANYLAPVTN